MGGEAGLARNPGYLIPRLRPEGPTEGVADMESGLAHSLCPRTSSTLTCSPGPQGYSSHCLIRPHLSSHALGLAHSTPVVSLAAAPSSWLSFDPWGSFHLPFYCWGGHWSRLLASQTDGTVPSTGVFDSGHAQSTSLQLHSALSQNCQILSCVASHQSGPSIIPVFCSQSSV